MPLNGCTNLYPRNCEDKFPLIYFFVSTFCFSVYFDAGHLTWGRCCCSFPFASPSRLVAWRAFHTLIGHLRHVFWEVPIEIIVHYMRIIWACLLKVLAFYIFWMFSFVRCRRQIFFSFYRQCLYAVAYSLCCVEAFYMDRPILVSAFVTCALRGLAYSYALRCSPVF